MDFNKKAHSMVNSLWLHINKDNTASDNVIAIVGEHGIMTECGTMCVPSVLIDVIKDVINQEDLSLVEKCGIVGTTNYSLYAVKTDSRKVSHILIHCNRPDEIQKHDGVFAVAADLATKFSN